jgi:hypothetical protein
MGSSFVKSNVHGFWICDGLLEIWLLSLSREIDSIAEPSAYLIEARQYWYLQATMGCVGCISPNIDDFITSEERRYELIQISEQAITHLSASNTDRDLKIEQWVGYGLRDTTLNTFLSSLSAVGQTNLIKTGRQFIKLLRGQVTSGVSDIEAVSWTQE